jgi:N-hydroxyarylamine O-acetyltransferase
VRRIGWGSAAAPDLATLRGLVAAHVAAIPLVDVGFGGPVLTGAQRLEPDVEQQAGHGPFRLVMLDGDWRMQSLIHETWQSLYVLDLRPSHHVDYVVSNHYVSTHPASFFVDNLVAARTAAGCRLSLFNCELTLRRPGSEPERHVLRGADE